MRIAFLCPRLSTRGGGLSAAAILLAEALVATGRATVDLIGFEPPAQAPDGPRTIVLPATGPSLFRVAPSLGAVLARGDYDLVHTHGLWTWASVAARRWQRTFGRPLVISPQGMLDGWALAQSAGRKRLALALFERRHLGAATLIHAVSEGEAAAVRALELAAPIAVIANPVPPPAPASAPPKPPRAGADDRKTLLYLGRLHRKKNVETLIAAWATAMTADPRLAASWRLVIAGWDDRGHVASLREAVRRTGAPQVSFPGPVYGADKAALLRSASAFVLPSFSEGLPVAVLEAWSYGLPVLASRACNLPEGFAAGAAIAIDTAPGRLAQQLATTLADEARLARAGTAGETLVRGQFAPEAIAARWITAYAGAVSDPAAAAATPPLPRPKNEKAA